MKSLSVLVLLALFPMALLAQTPGKSQFSIDIDETDYQVKRELYVYAPTDYDKDQEYALIVGFRGGPHSNAGQYRDQLAPLADRLEGIGAWGRKAIIVCPENIDEFNNSTEDKVKILFEYTMDTIRKLYNIPDTFTYVTGLSFGGRHAVITGLDSDAGPISGQIRGLIPFAPGREAHTIADYKNSKLFPVCTCIGGNDFNFASIARDLTDSLKAREGKARLNEIPGVGHTTAFPTFIDEMAECFDYIESFYSGIGINEVSLERSQSLMYPNPSHESFQIALEDVSVKIVDLIGKELWRAVNYQANTQIVHGLKPGSYLVQITLANDQVLTQKLIVD